LIEQELANQQNTPGKRAPTKQAVSAINAMNLHDSFNGASSLLRKLEKAELVSEKSETWEGKPARVLELKLPDAKGQKFIKEASSTGWVWIDAEGIPLAVKEASQQKGRAFLVVSFEAKSEAEFRFQRIGDRLVVVRQQREGSGSGAGESGGNKSITTLQVRETEALKSETDGCAVR